MNPEKTSAIILAAGASQRMHAFKPLLPLGGMTVLERAIALFRNAGVADRRVVVGYRAQELTPLLAGWGEKVVVNEHYRQGMFSSIVCALGELPPDREAFFVLPVDIPLVRRHTILELLGAGGEEGALVLYPAFGGERGHPPLIAARFTGQIAGWSGEGGLRACLRQFESVSREVEVADEGVLLDLDTEADYRLLSDRCGRLDVPSEKECDVLLHTIIGERRDIRAHCQAVSRVALQLVAALEEKGLKLQRELIQAAALLHDIARGRPDHAAAGAEMLRGMGYSRVAEIVAAHMVLRLTILDSTSPSLQEGDPSHKLEGVCGRSRSGLSGLGDHRSNRLPRGSCRI